MTEQILIDARPTLPVAQDSLWDKAGSKCDEIAEVILGEFRKRGVIAWVRKSKPGEYPLYVAVDSWVSTSPSERMSTQDRSGFKVEICVDPYLDQPLIYDVSLSRHAKKFQSKHWIMDAADLREIVGYLMVGGRKPKFFRPRAPLFVRLIDAIIPFVHLEPRNRIIKIARPNRFTVPTMLVAVGLVAVWFAYGAWQNEFEDSGNSWFVPVMLAAAAFVAASIIASRRKVLDAIPFQPARTPRREFLLDSWHVSVPEGGVDFLAFEERLLSRLRSLDKTIELAIETHQNLTPRGFEERERAVLSKGQATLHVHVYPFGTDAFVGWESYLNWNRWAEGEIVSTTVKDGAKLNFHSLGVGVHVPTDFDLIEANVLTETTHRILTKEIRLFLKEREIEADLDFKIIRGDRESALKRDLDDTAKPTKRTARRAVAMQ